MYQVQITKTTYSDDLSALALELLGVVPADIPGDGPNRPGVGELGVVEEDLGDGATLAAGGAKDGDDSLASHFGC